MSTIVSALLFVLILIAKMEQVIKKYFKKIITINVNIIRFNSFSGTRIYFLLIHFNAIQFFSKQLQCLCVFFPSAI